MARLVVDLKTNLVPRTDFQMIELHLIRRRRNKRMQENHVDFMSLRRGDYRRGVRITEINDLESASYMLMVRLLDDRGAPVAMRPALVSVRRDLAVTVLITR